MSQTAFDRAMSLTDMPDVLTVKPSTIQAVNALLGHGGTHIIQTARDGDGRFTIYLQVIDAGSSTIQQVVLPDAVCKVIYRQRQALIDRSRRKPAKTYPNTPAGREAKRADQQAARIRDARRILREAKNGK